MCFFKFMAEWGIWDIVGLIGATIPSALVVVYLFPRKAIKNLYVDTNRASVNQTYSKVIRVELRNHTNQPLYIMSEGFMFGSCVKPSPHGKKDAATGRYEVKFEGRQDGVLSEIDTLVRPNQVVSTWIPLDPTESDQSIDGALASHNIGTLRLKCQAISGRRTSLVQLKIPV